MSKRTLLVSICGIVALASQFSALTWNLASGLEEKTIQPDFTRIADTKIWIMVGAEATAVNKAGKQLMHLKAKEDPAKGANIVGMALVANVDFNTGTIDVDLKGKN